MKPMLATKLESLDKLVYPVYVQPKLNGIRAIWHGHLGLFTSRDEKWFMPHLAERLKSYLPKDQVLDGEFYVHGWPLNRIQGAVSIQRQEPNEDTHRIEYHIFDRISSQPFQERKLTVETGRWVIIIPTSLCVERIQVERLVKYFEEVDYEGAIIRTPNGPYQQDCRSKHLYKYKPFTDEEGTILAINEGRGLYHDMLGSFTIRNANGKVFNVGGGPGLTLEKRVDYWWDRQKLIGQPLTYRYNYTSGNGTPLQSQFIAIRNYE